MRALLAGWFSFEEMGATAGDLMVCDVVSTWLDDWGVPFDVARAAPFNGGVRLDSADPADYTHFVFLCGPCGNGPPIAAVLERFAHCRRVGVDLSMLEPLETWNPFDLLLERDSNQATRPDLALLGKAAWPPIVGLVLVHPQAEYGSAARHSEVEHVIRSFLAGVEAAIVPIDTRLDCNATGLRSASEVESLIARTDIVVTTRLHGLVLALKNGVPAIAIDPIAGGAKVAAQARSLGWPAVLEAKGLDVGALAQLWEWCRTDQAGETVRACHQRGSRRLSDVRQTLRDEFAHADVAVFDPLSSQR